MNRTALQEIADRGMVFCMPREPEIGSPEPDWSLFKRATCPECGAACMRRLEIPASARVACTRCALRLNFGAGDDAVGGAR